MKKRDFCKKCYRFVKRNPKKQVKHDWIFWGYFKENKSDLRVLMKKRLNSRQHKDSIKQENLENKGPNF